MRNTGGAFNRAGTISWRQLLLRSSASLAIAVAAPSIAQVTTHDPGVTAAGATPPAVATPVPVRINTTGQNVDLVVPLRDRVPLGQVTIRIGPDDRIGVLQTDLAAALKRSATPDFIKRIEALAASDGFVALDTLAGAGLAMRFDPGALELTTSLDASARPEQTLGFGHRSEAEPIMPDSSARFAAFLSYQATLDVVERGLDRGFRKPRADFNFNGRLFNLVAFENELTYDGEADEAFSRFGSRLIYDRPETLLRFSGGDLASVPVGFQGSVDVLGLGVSKLLNEFRPDRLFTATAGRQITLREPATVTIIVNGSPMRTLTLDRGSYALEDLPLTGGANNVELLIEDQAGGRRIVAFDFFQDVELLAPGIDEYDAQIGIRSEYDDGHRTYFRNDPIFSGFYRRGITEQLSLGANAQATRDGQQLGIEADLGTSFGLFSLEAVGSRMEGVGAGHAMRLQYRYSTPLQQLAGFRRFDVLIEGRSRDFSTVETLVPLNPVSWSLSARYSQPITARFSAGLGVDYRIGRDDNRDRYAIRANGSLRLRDNLSINASAGYENDSGLNVGGSLFWRLGRTALVTAQYDSREHDASVAYYHTPDRLLDSVAWGVEARRSSGTTGLTGTAVWRTNRGDLEFAQRAALDEAGEQVSSLRARGTFAFAGGAFAMGRYLSDSFAIVSPHRSLDGARVLVGSRIAEKAEARSGALGPALVAMSAYAKRSIFYDVPDAPPGYDFGLGTTELYPWLHAGMRATIGSEYNVTIFGTLLDDQGQPVALIAGTATRVGDATSPTVSIFTNREGRIGASGLGPGRWRIVAGDFVYDIDVAEAQGSFVDLNSIRPSGKRENRQ